MIIAFFSAKIDNKGRSLLRKSKEPTPASTAPPVSVREVSYAASHFFASEYKLGDKLSLATDNDTNCPKNT